MSNSESIQFETVHSKVHAHTQAHHHHTHAKTSHHAGGHHLLQVENLCVSFQMYDECAPYFKAKQHIVPVLKNLSISVHAGEVIAVVGQSGAGKTVLVDAILGLSPKNAEVKGSIWFDGKLLSSADQKQLRGSEIALVPQGVSHLDPMQKLKHAHGASLFERYGLGAEVLNMYPHQLSGGMARRVMLCNALAMQPRVILADEPTAGLDVVRAQSAFSDFRTFANNGGGVLLITHDISLALKVADRIAVFSDGTIVEETAVENFESPDLLHHKFSKALWHALPEHDFSCAERKKEAGNLGGGTKNA